MHSYIKFKDKRATVVYVMNIRLNELLPCFAVMYNTFVTLYVFECRVLITLTYALDRPYWELNFGVLLDVDVEVATEIFSFESVGVMLFSIIWEVA